MTIENLRQYTHFSKYSLFQKELGRKETRFEAGHRKFNMHREKYRTCGSELHGLIDEAEELFHEEYILGSQRALQYGGAAALKKNARIYNCVSSYCDRTRFFQECFWLLLCGNGTGFSAQKHHIAQLPPVARPRGNGSTIVHQIEDTIEGWADAAGMLMSSYFQGDDVPFPRAQGHWVDFDYSLIRAEGSKLSSGAGKAPGPEPLRLSLEMVRDRLESCVDTAAGGEVSLRPIDAYDIVMMLADAVLSGGVRRSATICLFSLDDEMMMNAKTGNWSEDHPYRGNSNNSVMLLRGEVTDEQFHKIKESTKQWGEPGFVWTDDRELLVNPCVEIGQWAKCRYGDAFPRETMNAAKADKLVSGWQFCNLSVINAARCRTADEFLTACRGASIVGTLQAGYTDFDYLGPVSEFITRREALLGVSITGMMDNPEIAFDYDLQRLGAQVVLDTNEHVAGLIGIRPAARATCIKPEGTSSCFLGTASGIHAHHATRFIRNNRANKNEGAAKHFQSVNPQAVEQCKRNPSNMILSFLVELPEGAIIKDDVTSLELLERVRMTRQAWVEGGRRPHLCTQPWLSHNVSNTINVKENEWDECFDYVSKHRDDFAGVAMLSHYGDLDWAQAPFIAVKTMDELCEEYDHFAVNEAQSAIKAAKAAFGDVWAACDRLMSDPIPQTSGVEQRFFSEMLRLAYDWTDSDIKEATYLIKKVHIAQRWDELQATMKDVDYTLMTEDDGMRIEAIQACAGGRCEI